MEAAAPDALQLLLLFLRKRPKIICRTVLLVMS